MPNPVPQSKICNLEENPDQMVRIYSIQDPEVLKTFDTQGYITGIPEHAFKEENITDEENWRRAYYWMRAQMAAKIDNFSGELPIWAYIKRPSNRTYFTRDMMRFNAPLVRIIALVPYKRMLLSDYELWHLPLGNGYLSYNEQEWDNANELEDKKELTQEEIEATWSRIFEINNEKYPFDFNWWGTKRNLQACIDRIYKEEVISLRFYK